MEHRSQQRSLDLESLDSNDSYGDSDTDPCEECSRKFMCCVFCCKYVHKATRIKIIWALLLFVALASSVILGCVIFRPDAPIVAPSDMRAVVDHVNFLFCDAVKINSAGLHFDTYRLSGPLKLDEVRRNRINFNAALFLEDIAYDYYSFYFLPNSSFTLDHCSRERVTFYVFQGQDNFDTWKDDHGCEECYVVKQYLQTSDCDIIKQTFRMSITTADVYFLVYENEYFETTWIDVQLELNRSIYDLTDAISICIDETECSVVLVDPQQTAVYQVASYDDLDKFRHTEFTTKCVPRTWSYLLFHGCFVLVTGITCSILIQKFCKNPDTNRVLNIQSRETTPLLHNSTGLPPNYSSVILSPPKYDDAIRYSDPPSYSDVAGAMSSNSSNRPSSTVSTESRESNKDKTSDEPITF